MNKIRIKAYGKVNLSLDIVGKRADGYHFVDMILHSVGVYDILDIDKSEEENIIIRCDKENIPVDERNIIYKAATEFFKHTKLKSGIIVNLEKNIPTEAGMGGGSADAAGVLIGLNKIFNANLSVDTLKDIGFRLGADVPFCIEGGCARAENLGEKLTKLPTIKKNVLIIKPNAGISTKAAYELVNLKNLKNKPDNENLIFAIKNNIDEIPKYMGNIFYDISNKFVPDIKDIVDTLSLNSGCEKAIMSGSGSTVFGLFDNTNNMNTSGKFFEDKGYEVFYTTTVETGIVVE
ncbi:MAG: 4-(cytidine 5'-diphospho)-2-C-methyl-D-erythritol kinase [Filifactoraceae bacterium]